MAPKINIWISLEELADKHAIPILAKAAEISNMQVINNLGQKVLANDGDASELNSKAYALELLAGRYSAQQNPGPDDDFYNEQAELSDNPMYRFGWPEDVLPDFNAIEPDYKVPSKPTTPPVISNKPWQEVARDLADIEYAKDTANGVRDRVQGYASRIIPELQKRVTHWPRSPINNPKTIVRDALQGPQWWKKKTSI